MFGLLFSSDLDNIGRTPSRLARCPSKTSCIARSNASKAFVEACQLIQNIPMLQSIVSHPPIAVWMTA